MVSLLLRQVTQRWWSAQLLSACKLSASGCAACMCRHMRASAIFPALVMCCRKGANAAAVDGKGALVTAAAHSCLPAVQALLEGCRQRGCTLSDLGWLRALQVAASSTGSDSRHSAPVVLRLLLEAGRQWGGPGCFLVPREAASLQFRARDARFFCHRDAAVQVSRVHLPTSESVSARRGGLVWGRRG